MKIKINSTTKPRGLKFCTDINGRQHRHGDFFTPQRSACTRCVCTNGRADSCIQLQCQKPACTNFERIPGTCCEYKCPREFVLTDKSTAAVVASLSIILVVILVAISLVWKKLKKKEKYGQRFQAISTSSSQQETDLDSLIQKNSIPNNMRHNSIQKQTQSRDKNPLLATNHDLGATSSMLPSDDKDKFLNKNNSDRTPSHPSSNTNLVVVMSDTQDNKSALSSGKRQSVATTSTTTNACCSAAGNNSVCMHKLRRFEPPPPYSANKLDNDAPIDFV